MRPRKSLLILFACVAAAACRPASEEAPPIASEATTDAAYTLTTLETFSGAPVMAWEGLEGVRRYEIEMARDEGFAGIFLRDTTPVPRYVASNGLAPGTHFWRARPAGTDAWVAGGKLSVLIPETVVEVPEGADAETIIALAKKAADASPAVLRFPERGSFRIAVQGSLFNFEAVSGILVDGRGSTITFTTPMSGFARMKNCREITFRDLLINHDPPPFTVGRILAVDHATGELEIAIEPGHPDLDAPHILTDWGFCMFLEPEGRGRIRDDSPLVPNLDKSSLRRIPGGFAIRATSPETMEVVRPGDRVVQFARKGNAQSLFHAERSPDLAFVRITNHSISGGHYLLLECDGARILNCHSFPAPGRTYGANADGAHVRSPVVGPWIEGCSFEAVGDDGVALFAKGIEVTAQPSPRQVVLGSRFFNIEAGQEILFFNPREGEPVGPRVKVVSVTPGEDAFLLEIEPPLDVPLAFDFEGEWNKDQAFNMTAQQAGFVVRRNTFRDIRRYGIISRASHGAIEDNLFVGISDSAITLQNEPNFWRNGLQSEAVSITGNRIQESNFSRHARGRGAIHVALRAIADVRERWGDKPAAWRGHRDLVLADNEITAWRESAIYLRNIDGLLLENNRILNQLPSLPDSAPARAIEIRNVGNATVAGNVFDGLQPGTRPILSEGSE